MNTFEILMLALVTPVSALLIALWVSHESRKITEQAHARARAQQMKHR
ncbi:hypothetical protein [Jiella sp. M17.18]